MIKYWLIKFNCTRGSPSNNWIFLLGMKNWTPAAHASLAPYLPDTAKLVIGSFVSWRLMLTFPLNEYIYKNRRIKELSFFFETKRSRSRVRIVIQSNRTSKRNSIHFYDILGAQQKQLKEISIFDFSQNARWCCHENWADILQVDYSYGNEATCHK